MDPYTGELRIFAGNYAPEGWHFCDGSALSVNDYPALYAVIGTTYGGSGSVFNLPNMQGRVAISKGTAPSGGTTNHVIGQSGGTTTVTLTTAMMPQHTHALMASASNATLSDPTNAVLAVTQPGTGYSDVKLYSTLPSGTTAPNAILDDPTGSTGGGAAHSNVQPSIVVSYIICMNGLFPQNP